MTRTMLLSLAHPDDETFYAAGTILRYRGEGVRVVLVCATRGERGNRGEPELCSIEELGRVREAELHAAARILGIDEVHVLDYQDQQLSAAKPEDMRSILVGQIRRCKPDVVVTFDPNGGNCHTDHVAMSRFTMEAVNAAADARWFSEQPPFEVPRVVWTPAVQPWRIHEKNGSSPGVDFLLDIRPWREQKLAALCAHKTQNPGITRVFLSGEDRDARLRFEAFRQAAGPRLTERPVNDLFAGL